MPGSASELDLDLEELEGLLGHATRPNIKEFLLSEIKRLRHKQITDVSNDPQKKIEVVSHQTTVSTQKITTYAWDQSDKFLKIYLTLNDAQNAKDEQVKFESDQSSVSVLIRNINGRNHEWTAKDLLHVIVPEKSYFKLKKDTVLLMLKKEEENERWNCITKVEVKKEKPAPKVDTTNEDPQAGLMSMMKQMYDDGDDEMKRTIRKSWHESQSKKKDEGVA